MAKLIAVDANAMGFIFDSGMTVVKPFCKKKNSPKKINNAEDFSISQKDVSNSQVLILSSLCNPQFQFELFSWETSFSENIATISEHFPSNLSYHYLDNDSPPPRLA
ncbi:MULTISPECIES: hypothetical protein [Flavobacteriaceae]|uniref:Uncharacterized protein n=2 Tax=Flavobacteriaceae TaxID=49546 RepID=A3XIV8_LEEBM|nr:MULTISPECIES: hypothetical protein [Flavobacteriaceae]ADF52150.1 conserved hypothetical protein [Zunongwangia profunda SM-A87]EAQ50516.1 hypothetical protein MED217_05772 [Leeuwenhoekiella blandensis MED217]